MSKDSFDRVGADDLIIDSHCHGWPRWPFDPLVPDPESRGRLEQLMWEMDRAGVDQAVIVCAGFEGNRDNVGYVSRFANQHAGRLHVFADVDCLWAQTYHTDGAAARLSHLTKRRGLKGFTHYLRDEVDDWFESRAGRDFLEMAASRGLVMSLSANPDWQPVIRKIARRYPTLRIVCHHMGFVRRRGSQWVGLKEVLKSAELPNVLLKVSGFHYSNAGQPMQGMTLPATWDFPYTASLELLRTLYETYGAHRLCWGSDHPVVEGSMTYRQSLEVVRSLCDFITDEDKEWVLGKTMLSLLTAVQ